MNFRIVIFFFILLTGPLYGQTDSGTVALQYSSPAGIEAFANYLFNDGDYIRAAGEFERLRFFLSDIPARDSALFASGRSFMKGHDYQNARKVFSEFQPLTPNSHFPIMARVEIARLDYFESRYQEMTKSLLRFQTEFESDSSFNPGVIPVLLGMAYARQGKWNESSKEACGNLTAPYQINAGICSLFTAGPIYRVKIRPMRCCFRRQFLVWANFMPDAKMMRFSHLSQLLVHQ